MTTAEVWEPHPRYPHEGSSLGRARRIGTDRILARRPNNTPKDTPPEERYHLIDIWMPRPPCVQQADGRWKHLKHGCKCKETVSEHVFITECHWGLKKYARQVARHVHGGSKADSSWDNLLGWGFPSDNEFDKPPEVRSAAARTARAAQIAAMPRPKRKWRRVTLKLTFRLPLPRRKRSVIKGEKRVSKPITKEGVWQGR